jgi:hypothetical protein
MPKRITPSARDKPSVSVVDILFYSDLIEEYGRDTTANGYTS